MRIAYIRKGDEAGGGRPVGRPKKTWSKVVEEDS